MSTDSTLNPVAKQVRNEREWRDMKCDICIIGWIGLILSSSGLLMSALALHYRRDLVEFFMGLTLSFYDQINGNKIVVAGSTTVYALSLLNLVACTMLLIGVERRTSALLIPWLIFHAVCFAGIAHFGLYITLTLFFEDLPKFLISLVAFSGGLTIFAKILIDVFNCITKIEDIEEQRRRARDVEKRKPIQYVGLQGCSSSNSAVPYCML